jgi:hypothetical protein
MWVLQLAEKSSGTAILAVRSLRLVCVHILLRGSELQLRHFDLAIFGLQPLRYLLRDTIR